MNNIDIISSINIKGDLMSLYKYVVPIDLSIIFKKYGLIPGVKASSNTEIWYKAGLKRIVTFDDGSSAKEQLLSINEPNSFSYIIFGFSSTLKYIIEQIEGEWKFLKNDSLIEITWVYSIRPKNLIGILLIMLVIKRSMQNVLNNALMIIKKNYEMAH